jgi:phosphate starvation-inducible protein PhoH and related proteins
MAKTFEINNKKLSLDQIKILFGENDKNIKIIEKTFDVSINYKDDLIVITTLKSTNLEYVANIVESLIILITNDYVIDTKSVEQAILLAANNELNLLDKLHTNIVGKTVYNKIIAPKTIGQLWYVKALANFDIVFGIGPAGTGKTYLAVAHAVSMLKNGVVKKIILTRPAVEAGESLGFLPGDLKEKIDPYLQPLYDALNENLGKETVVKMIEKGTIEIAPLAYMRGRTLEDAFVILDEAQNTTILQLKMFLTRLGTQSKMVVTGDITQIDLPPRAKSGLIVAKDILKNIKEISFIRLNSNDVCRNPLVQKIIDAYDKYDNLD